MDLVSFPPQAVTADSGSEDEAMEQKRALEEVRDMSWNVSVTFLGDETPHTYLDQKTWQLPGIGCISPVYLNTEVYLYIPILNLFVQLMDNL